MQRKISLKWVAVLSFFTMATVLIVGFSFLSVHFFRKGMDNITADNMLHIVESYLEVTPPAKRTGLARFSGCDISLGWQQMPQLVKRLFKMPKEAGILHINDESGWFSRPDKILFLMRVDHDGDSYYICRTMTRKNASPLVGRNAARNINLLLLISISTTLVMICILWIIFRKIEQPVRKFGTWTRDFNAKTLHELPPDFVYPELNDLAIWIRTSLSSVEESLEREHKFLRHSSHELRTPISIIRNNIELFKKVEVATHQGDTLPNSDENTDEKRPETPHNEKFRNCRTCRRNGNGQEGQKRRERLQKKIIDRIDRASLTMKHLTETLLWLSRESDEAPPRKELDLEPLVRELIADARYLLKGKESVNESVEVVVQTAPFSISVAEIPARIVIGNLLRNAFQHTWQGRIDIIQIEDTVKIINDISNKEGDGHDDLGFGLGLQLTVQLTKKLNWSYKSFTKSSRYYACLTLPEQ